MKVLFIDDAINASISSLNASTNYPASNLADIFLRRRYQNLAGSDTVTLDLGSDKTINCFFAGYHNALTADLITEDADYLLTEDDDVITLSDSKLTLRLYDYTGALLYTEELDLINQFEAVYFPDVLRVRTATITVDWGVGAGYLGGAGLGQAYTMPDPTDGMDDLLEDKSIVSESDGGQVMQGYIEPLIMRKVSFSDVPRETYIEIMTYMKTLGKGRPVWMDFNEKNHDYHMPGFMQIVDGLEDVSRDHSRDTYNFTLTFKEAR